MTLIAWTLVAVALGLGAAGGWLVGLAGTQRSVVPDPDADPEQPPVGGFASAQLASLVLQVLGHGVVVVDRDERVVLANPAARSMGVLDGDRLAFAELAGLARAATDGGTVVAGSADLPMGRLGREPVNLSATAVPLMVAADDRVASVVLLLDDVTEQRRLEAVRRDFVANVSHELKTPVGALTLLAEAVTEAADDPEAVQRFAGRMQHEGVRLGRLVRELIELSRLQGAEPLPGDQQVLVARVIDEAVDRSRLVAESAGIELRISASGDLAVRGNESQLAMAVANLIDNAIAYSARGTRVAIIARATLDQGQPRVEIAISDQGIGIAEAELTRVFERFYRVDPARSRATGGTGLGLAIVKHVATNHGGSVSVWSVEGAGSTFTIRLPLVHPRAGTSDSDAVAERNGAPTTMAKGTA